MNLPEISLAIADAEARKATLHPLPNLSELQGRVNYLTSQTLLDPERRGDLQAAMHTLDHAVQQHEKAKQIDRELSDLKQKLQIAEYDNEQAKREQAKRDREEIFAEYKLACLQAGRAFRRCLNNHIDPGDFHASVLFSPYWQGTLGQAMREGRQPWEKEA